MRYLDGILMASLALAACDTAPKLPPPRPAADMCDGDYKSFRYSPAAAAVEAVDAIMSHNFNEARFHERCLLSPNRSTQGGSR